MVLTLPGGCDGATLCKLVSRNWSGIWARVACRPEPPCACKLQKQRRLANTAVAVVVVVAFIRRDFFGHSPKLRLVRTP